jgi:hypothetical protein
MSTPPAEPPPSPRLPTGLLVASTLCWTWGILCGFSGVTLLVYVPALTISEFSTVFVITGLTFVPLGIVYCVSGYLIRKGRLAGGWMGLIPAGIVSTLTLFAIIVTRSINLSTAASLALNRGIVLSLLRNWRFLRTSSAQGGA